MRPPAGRRCRGEDGVTLVELLTAMAISALVLAVVSGTVIQALAAQRRHTAQLAALHEAKVAFERITRDIRGANPLQVAALNRVAVALPGTATPVRTVTYARVGAALVATDSTTGVPRTLIDRLPAGPPLFAFHLVDGSTATGEQALDPGAVRSVTVRLQVEPAGGGRPVDLEHRVVLRNGGPR